MNKNKKEIPDVGQRVLMLESHPHYDKIGTVITQEGTLVGLGAKIQFQDGTLAFVFRSDQWKPIT